MKVKGVLQRFYLPYKENGAIVSNENQALQIFEYAKKALESGAKGIAITYSANYGQTQKIEQTYRAGEWNTATNGSNQAAVVAAMETMLWTSHSSFQMKIRIAPITTMTYTGYGNRTHREIVEEDLVRIRVALENGWDVLGWVNQDSQPEFAIGGGIAAGLDENGAIRFPKALSDFVQEQLSEMANKFS